jgi:hypothetical protein
MGLLVLCLLFLTTIRAYINNMMNHVALATTRSRLITSALNSRGDSALLLKTSGLSSFDKLSSFAVSGARLFSSISRPSAIDAFKLLCYHDIDYISEDAM